MLRDLLWRYARPYRSLLIAVLVFQFISAIGMLYLPNLNARIIDNGVAQGDTGYIWRMGALMLVVTILRSAAAIAATYFAAKGAMAMGRDLRNDIYARVSGFSEREISLFGAGSLITRSTNDVQQVQMLAMTGATMLVSAPLLAIGGIIMALQQDVSLSSVLAITVPVLLGLCAIILARMVPLFRAYQVEVDSINRIMREQLTGVRVVRAFVREHIEAARYRVVNTNLMVVGRKVGSLFVLTFPLAMLIMNITMLAVIWFGSARVDSGAIQIGTMLAFLQYVGQILGGVLMATFTAMMIPRAAVSAERISAVLKEQPRVHDAENPVTAFPAPGTIEFDDVTFTYPGAEAPILDRVSFTAHPGQTVAVVGSTGAGKTTLVNLVARMIDTTSGTVRVGGVDVRDLKLDDLWATLGLVPQKPYLFAGTVASNVRFGNENATDAEVWEALEIAQAADFVREMPDGINSRIAQGGTNVSGGQRQRLAIARAVLRKPPVLLLDDSFSALDVATDARLRAALWRSLPQVTKLVVAQRVTTITDADAILVLDDGHVVGFGTHEQLLETCPTYREIALSQISVEQLAQVATHREPELVGAAR